MIAIYPRRHARRAGGSVIGAGLGGPESLVDWLLRSVGLAPLASRAASSTQRAERRPEWPPHDARPRPRSTARRRRPRARGTGALGFDVYEENSGRYRWRLMTGDGHDLATSTASFATHAEAARAAGENRG